MKYGCGPEHDVLLDRMHHQGHALVCEVQQLRAENDSLRGEVKRLRAVVRQIEDVLLARWEKPEGGPPS